MTMVMTIIYSEKLTRNTKCVLCKTCVCSKHGQLEQTKDITNLRKLSIGICIS